MRVLVTGARGLVGSAVMRHLIKNDKGIEVLGVSTHECDLTIQADVNYLFKFYKPDAIIHTAARVGGIRRNLQEPFDQFTDNILMNTLILSEARHYGIDKVIAFSSICAFPTHLESFGEDDLHNGPPFQSHEFYAYAKRMVDVQIRAHKAESEYPHKENWISVIPANIFGPHDMFNIEIGHVVPSLIAKAHTAAAKKMPLEVWGTGDAKREFIFSGDLAKICTELLLMDNLPTRLLVSGPEWRIGDIAKVIADHFKIELRFNTSQPEGQKARVASKAKFNELFPSFFFSDIKEKLIETCIWYQQHEMSARR